MQVKRTKTIYIFLIVLILIITGVITLATKINPILQRIMDHKLTALIRNDPERLYDITYDSLKIDIRKGNVRIVNLMMVPRKEISDSLSFPPRQHKYSVNIQLGKFEMLDFHWMKFLRTNKIVVEEFRLSDLMVRYYLTGNTPIKKQPSFGQDILDQKFISAETKLIELINGNLRMFTIREDTSLALSFDSLKLRFTEFYSDSTLLKKPIGYKLEEVDLSLMNLRNELVKNYEVICDKISFNSRDNLFSLKRIQMNPSQEKRDSKNWLKLKVSSLDASGINYDSLLSSGTILINRLLVDEPDFTYVRPVERLQKDTIRYLPGITFKNIPIPLAIDTIEIQKGHFDYLKHGHREPMIRLKSTDIHVQGLFFSSDPVRLNKNKTFYVSGTTRFLDEAGLTMNFTFPLMDPVNTFVIKGTMDTLDARSLNPIIKNSKKIEINNGIINNLQFKITGNDTLSTGSLQIDYHDLKLVAIKVNEGDFTETQQKGFLTGILNIVARSKNDPDKTSFTEGVIYLERDPYYTFLDYSLESLMTGVLTSMVPESKMFIKPKKSKK